MKYDFEAVRKSLLAYRNPRQWNEEEKAFRAQLEKHLYEEPVKPLGPRPFPDDVTEVLMAGLNGAQLQTKPDNGWMFATILRTIQSAINVMPIRVALKSAYQWQRPTEKGQRIWKRDRIIAEWYEGTWLGVDNWSHGEGDEETAYAWKMLVAVNPDNPNTPPPMDYVPEGNEE